MRLACQSSLSVSHSYNSRSAPRIFLVFFYQRKNTILQEKYGSLILKKIYPKNIQHQCGRVLVENDRVLYLRLFLEKFIKRHFYKKQTKLTVFVSGIFILVSYFGMVLAMMVRFFFSKFEKSLEIQHYSKDLTNFKLK